MILYITATEHLVQFNSGLIKELDQYAADLIDTAEHQHERFQKAIDYSAVGEYYRHFKYSGSQKGEWVPYYQKVIAILGEDTGMLVKETIANAYLNIGKYYEYNYNYGEAVNHYNYALRESFKGNDSASIRAGYSYLSDLYLKIYDYRSDIAYMDSAKEYITWKEKTEGDDLVMNIIYVYSLADAYLDWYLADKNESYRIAATKYISELPGLDNGDHDCDHMIHFLKAKQNFATADYGVTLLYLDSFSKDKQKDVNIGPAESASLKGIALLKLGKGAEGKATILAIENLNDDPVFAATAYQEIYKYEKARNNFAEALKYYELARKYEDSVNVVRQKGRVFEIAQKYAVHDKEKNIKNLQLLNLRQSRQRSLILTAALGVSLLLTVIILILYSISNKTKLYNISMQKALEEEQHKLTDILQEQDHRIQQETENAVRNVKRKISNDMHDEVSSSLAALTFFITDLIGRTNIEEVKMNLQIVEDEARSVYRSAREFMHSLHNNSSMAVRYNVVDLLAQMEKTFSGNSFLRLNVQVDYDNIKKLFTQTIHEEMYMIIKEAITNTIKHADGANTINIQVLFENDTCYFEIADNGRPKVNATAGLGMKSITDRIKNYLQGNLEVSQSSEGTRLKGYFPV